MKIQSASFKNFKLLKDVRVEFGLEPGAPLTVVRAENASGKTSMLNGLRWGMFGIKGLDSATVRLSATDQPDRVPCEIEVRIEFDHTEFVPVGPELVPRHSRYRLIRRVSETPTGDKFSRGAEAVSLYELRAQGAAPVANPEATVDRIIPLEMKDIFFTDGDAALSFISSAASKGARRQQVKDAIKSLLGLWLLEDALKHVKSGQGVFRARAAAAVGSRNLEQLEQVIETEISKQEAAQKAVAETHTRLQHLERQYEEADKALVRALQEGNHEELSRRIEQARKQRAAAQRLEKDLKQKHQKLFEAESLSWALARPILDQAGAKLAELHDRGVIPRTTIPVLKDRLSLQRCICGASLAPGSTGRVEVEQLIESQKSADEERQRLTRLYHELETTSGETEARPGAWMSELDAMEKNRLEVMRLDREAGEDMRYCEQQIRAIDIADVEQKRSTRETIRANLAMQQRKLAECQIQQNQAQGKVADLEERFKDLMKASKKDAVASARLLAANDVLAVMECTLKRLQDEYLAKVSGRMNELFMEMIGADPEQGGLFKEAVITPDFEIAVLAHGDRTLDPEFDLNGASKRALTFAFVWALTEVSGVVAPRIIDTPLGMMSGAVKRRVLELVSKPSEYEVDKQVVLLLTRSEIAGTEDVLDRLCGHWSTLTNTIHFPKDLAHAPSSRAPMVLICACDHRSVCQVCERREDTAKLEALRA